MTENINAIIASIKESKSCTFIGLDLTGSEIDWLIAAKELNVKIEFKWFYQYGIKACDIKITKE